MRRYAKSYAGGSLSSWQGHPSHIDKRVGVRRRVAHSSSRLGWYPTHIKIIILHKLQIRWTKKKNILEAILLINIGYCDNWAASVPHILSRL
jgi:hypothetical protein